jgi:hypothetical protein
MKRNRFQQAIDDMEEPMSFEDYMKLHHATIHLALLKASQEQQIKELK